MIRRATATDAPAIHRVLLDAFEPLEDRYTPAAFDATVLDPDRVRLRLDDGPVWLAELDGAVVGTFGIEVTDEGHYLRGMGVSPAARGAGLGKRLVDVAVGYVDEHRPPRAWLFTTHFLDAAIALYERAGFVRFDPDPAHFHGTPIIGMERLNPLSERALL
ncbi:MAG: GNAT family N-acetyltransferase [Actinomycetota bacterium]